MKYKIAQLTNEIAMDVIKKDDEKNNINNDLVQHNEQEQELGRLPLIWLQLQFLIVKLKTIRGN